MKEGKLGRKGYVQGDMSPTVEDTQRPVKSYAEQDFNKTTQYIDRHNRFEGKEAGQVRKQDYKGRYS